MPSRSCFVGTVRYSVARETDSFSATPGIVTASYPPSRNNSATASATATRSMVNRGLPRGRGLDSTTALSGVATTLLISAPTSTLEPRCLERQRYAPLLSHLVDVTRATAVARRTGTEQEHCL